MDIPSCSISDVEVALMYSFMAKEWIQNLMES